MKAGVIESIIILITLSLNAFGVSGKCPLPQEILPCSCYIGPYLPKPPPIVTCSNIKDFGPIKQVLSGKFPQRYFLKLTSIQEKLFARGTAQEITPYGLYVHNSPMVEYLGNNSLIDMASSLEFIEISGTSLKSIPNAALSKLPKLFDLNILKSNITQVLKKDIQGLPKLILILSLNGNPITNIEEGSFTSMTRMQYLYCNDCRLKTLPSGNWLSPLICFLYLRNNEFTRVPLESFSTIKDGTVCMKRNKIRFLPSETELVKFFDNWNELHLQGNNVQCTCDLKWFLKCRYISPYWNVLQGNCSGGIGNHKEMQFLTAADFAACKNVTLYN